MGACCSSRIPKGLPEEQLSNSKINKMISLQQINETYVHNILLLGPGDAGKTTVLKQMRKIYPSLTPDHDSFDTNPNPIDPGFSAIIRERVMGYMKILCEQSINLNIDIDEKHTEYRDFFAKQISAPYGNKFNAENCNKINALWSDPGIKLTLKRRNEYQIADNVEYFMSERVDDIGKDDYVVTFEDFLRVRMRTTGFMSEIFKKMITGNEHQFVFTDVGGQRSERAKWMNMMNDDIDAVLYVVAISEYDLVCFEDSSTKRLDEALSLFETVINHGFCSGKTVTLFFNKYDLFQEKIKDSDAKTMKDIYPDDWPQNKDPRNEDHVCKYIYRKFLKIYKKGLPDSEQTPHYHRTTALDTEQIDILMEDIVGDLIKGRLLDIGF